MYPVPAETDSAQPQSVSLEESQEGSEWAIRIGNAPPPAWSKKRSLTQEDTLEDDRKRKRAVIGYVFWPLVDPFTECYIGSLYIVLHADVLSRPSIEADLCVREIATVYRFTPAEVGEYYLRVNRNTGRTRKRFEKARKLLDVMSDVE